MPFTDEQRSAENCNLSMIYTVKKEEPNDFLLMVQWLEHRLLLQNTWVQFLTLTQQLKAKHLYLQFQEIQRPLLVPSTYKQAHTHIKSLRGG